MLILFVFRSITGDPELNEKANLKFEILCLSFKLLALCSHLKIKC